MKDVTAETAKKTSQKSGNTRNAANQGTALDRCYGKIGISAVAAAVRYQGTAKNPAYAPVVSRWREPADEAAA